MGEERQSGCVNGGLTKEEYVNGRKKEKNKGEKQIELKI